MRRFKYRLERVLHFRSLVEASAKRELQLAQRELVESEAQLAFFEGELIKDFSKDFSAAGGTETTQGSVRVEEFLLGVSYRDGLRIKITNQLLDIETKKDVVVERMTKYREAARELESLQRHRVTKVTEYDYEVSLAEQAQIDELMAQRHGQK